MSHKERHATPPAAPAVAEACRHAGSAYPDECCGFIRRSGAVHRATNVQGIEPRNSHGLDDRLADRAFTFAASDLYALSASFRSNDPAICIYHSHPDAGAYFSAMDRREALYAGLPKYPVTHLVISVIRAQCAEIAMFDWDGREFECVWRDAPAGKAGSTSANPEGDIR